MAFYDWNNNGKKDWQDDFIEYNIYKNCIEKKKNTNTYRNNNGDSSNFWAVVIVIGIVLFIGWIGMSCEAKCAATGCDNKPATDSSYCWLHKNRSYRSYKSSNYSNTGSSSISHSYETGSSDYSGTSNRANNEVVTTKKYYSTKKNTTTQKKHNDPYNVYEYSDPEDFYDDNYDDFESYEDAEDYYNDAWD